MNSKEYFIIQGLSGQKKLKGSVKINGAKNAALKAMAAAVLFDGPVSLGNIPDTSDIETMISVLTKLGAKVNWNRGKSLNIDSSLINSTDIDPQLAGSMRASVVLTGPLLARYGKVSFPAPGGCVIGARPIDLFLEGYQKMGASVTLADELHCIESAQTEKKLKGTTIHFKKKTVGGTETLMMAAVLAKGTTVLENCAMEPEIVNVAEWLNACGADIKGVGTETITVEGTGGKLLTPKSSYLAIPDRIEAGSFLILGALCAEELTIENCRPDHLEEVIELLKNSGVSIEATNLTIKVKGAQNPKSFNVRTREYPGFPTDLQSPMVTYLTQSEGESTVTETIFEGRFKFTEDLVKMGANIETINPQEIIIKGPVLLESLPEGQELKAHDIRAGFAIVLAALVAEGTSKINNIHLIDRGYEKLEERLTALGADIKRVL